MANQNRGEWLRQFLQWRRQPGEKRWLRLIFSPPLKMQPPGPRNQDRREGSGVAEERKAISNLLQCSEKR